MSPRVNMEAVSKQLVERIDNYIQLLFSPPDKALWPPSRLIIAFAIAWYPMRCPAMRMHARSVRDAVV